MANKGRVKTDKALQPVADWDDADRMVREMGDLQTQVKQAEQSAKDDINETKADLAEKVKPLQEQIKGCVQTLEAFAVNRKADFKGNKSRKLNFGVVGWRKSTSISIKKTTLELIKKVFSKAKAAHFIHTKETVDKEALAKLTDKDLTSVGARRKVKDDFFVEPVLPEAVDYCG